jgi:hypothetical protein
MLFTMLYSIKDPWLFGTDNKDDDNDIYQLHECSSLQVEGWNG